MARSGVPVELSYAKGSIQEAANELDIDPGRISKWRQRHKKTIESCLPIPPLRTNSNRSEGCNESLERLRWSAIYPGGQHLLQGRREISHPTSTWQKPVSLRKSRATVARIADELREQGVKASRNCIARIMKKARIRSITCKKYRGQTTESNRDYPIAKNVLNREFTADKPGQKWVSDITAQAALLHRYGSGVSLSNRNFGSGRPKSGWLGHER
ncbi:IS3 family transposase [Spirosoma luteum]|uniref:IS3 family transposase n=1 Tax=Spirosoma luteum TaxID=431553 RepID=UPI003CCBEA70